MKNKSIQKDSFIVRIWREEGRIGWRGWIQHVRTGDSALAQNLDELVAFIEHQTGKLTSPGRKGLK